MIRQGRKNKKKYRFFMLLCFVVCIAVSLFIFILIKDFFPLFSRYPFISPIPHVLISVKGVTFPANNNTAMEIKILMQQKNVPTASIEQVSDTSYKIVLFSGEEVYLSSQKSLAEQISSLQRILSRLTIEGKHFVRLDVRFDKPVITLK